MTAGTNITGKIGTSAAGQHRTRPAGRRALALATAACTLASAAALLAVSRTWAVVVTERPSPLPPATDLRTGTSLAPAVTAFALVALAGAGALLATRRAGRAIVSALIALSGLVVVVAAALALPDADGARRAWPVVCVAAGAVVAVVGALALARGSRWPSMGTRYERAARPDAPARGEAEAKEAPAAPAAGDVDGEAGEVARTPEESDPARTSRRRSADQFWDAIDRGDDPTAD
jgi:hypothetical protein